MPTWRTTTGDGPTAPKTRHSWPSHSTARTWWAMLPPADTSRCSGRAPTITGWPSSRGVFRSGGTGNRLSPTSTAADPSLVVTVPASVFMGGVPMNWATNRLAGAGGGEARRHGHGFAWVGGAVHGGGLAPPV